MGKFGARWIVAAVLLLCARVSCGQAAAPAAPPFATQTVRDALGVNIHFTDAKPGELDMLARAGFGWVRMDLAWDSTETQPGVYDFAAYDRLMAGLDAHHIRALFILDYHNKFYDQGLSPHSAEGRAAFAKWAAAAATHYKGRNVVWEIYNEPNIGFWKPKPNPDDYARMAVAATEAIHRAVPAALVIGPASSTIDLKFIETCLNAGLGEQWAAISVHPYRQANPERVAPEYVELRRLLLSHDAAARPIVAGEWGYSAVRKGFDADLQGRYDVRLCLTNLAHRIPLTILYDWHDDGVSSTDPECNFGLVRNAYHVGRDPVYDPKPAYLALRTLTEQLGKMHFDHRVDVGTSDDYVLVFTDGRQERLVAWTTGKPHRVQAALPSATWAVIDMHGAKVGPARAEGTQVSIELSAAPQYLRAP